MAGKKERDGFRELRDQTVKAIRRGEKLAKTLTRIVAQTDPAAPAQLLLTSVEKGIAQLRSDVQNLEGRARSKKRADKAKGALKPKAAKKVRGDSAKTKAGAKAPATGKMAVVAGSKKADLPLP